VNLVEAAIAAIDGEKDPRCLLTSFQLLQVGACVFHSEVQMLCFPSKPSYLKAGCICALRHSSAHHTHGIRGDLSSWSGWHPCIAVLADPIKTQERPPLNM